MENTHLAPRDVLTRSVRSTFRGRPICEGLELYTFQPVYFRKLLHQNCMSQHHF
jgi:hypothetical protein